MQARRDFQGGSGGAGAAPPPPPPAQGQAGRAGALLPAIALALLSAPLSAPAGAQQALSAAEPQPDPRVLLGFVLFVAALAFGLGRYAWQLRRDFVALIGSAPRDPGIAAADRLELFRSSPGGVPEGTVRAVIAIAVVLLALPAMVFSRALGLPSTGEFGTIIGGVLGFYFGTRGSGGDAEAARRGAELLRREADAGAVAAREAQDAAEAAAASLRDTGEAASRLDALARRAAEGAAVARAVAGLLPAGRAAAALHGAGDATAAIAGAIASPTPGNVASAVEAASAALRAAGEGTELADRLGGALGVLRDATGAIGAVRAALDDPAPARVAAALAEAGRAMETGADGGLGGTIAPAVSAIGAAMRLPALAGLLGAAGPAGIAGGLLLGAVEAAALGRQHYARWTARVLDRPVTRDLFPGGEWDGEAARALIAEVPSLAAALAPELDPGAPQARAAAALARLLDPGAGAWLWESRPNAFASEAEADAAVAALRRAVLEAELDRVDPRPVPLGDGAAIPPARLRADLDRLREAGAGGAIDSLALLADGVIHARPAPPDLPGLLRRALAMAGG
jgi:hypothetical protein